jgi:hypothetical protein
MPTNCTVIQFLEPDPQSIIYTGADDHSLPVEEGGVLNLSIGVQTYTITFVQAKLQDDYDFIEDDVNNTVDPDPLNLDWDLTARDRNGFTVVFNGLPDTSNYSWNWKVRIGSLTS